MSWHYWTILVGRAPGFLGRPQSWPPPRLHSNWWCSHTICKCFFFMFNGISTFFTFARNAGDGPDAKKPKLDDDLKGGMANLVKGKVTEVRSRSHWGHCSHFTWALWCLESLATWLFIQQIVQTNNKENINALHYWPLWGSITVTCPFVTYWAPQALTYCGLFAPYGAINLVRISANHRHVNSAMRVCLLLCQTSCGRLQRQCTENLLLKTEWWMFVVRVHGQIGQQVPSQM